MAGKAIGKSMNLGYAGNYSRMPDDIVASRLLNAESQPIVFGQAVEAKDDNTFTAINGSTKAPVVAGIALRIVKQAVSYNDQNETAYQPGEMISVLERGTATVVCTAGTPKAGSKVYVRIKANEMKSGTVIGGFEAEADSSNTIEIPNMCWTTGKLDANRVAEVTILTRVAP